MISVPSDNIETHKKVEVIFPPQLFLDFVLLLEVMTNIISLALSLGNMKQNQKSINQTSTQKLG